MAMRSASDCSAPEANYALYWILCLREKCGSSIDATSAILAFTMSYFEKNVRTKMFGKLFVQMFGSLFGAIFATDLVIRFSWCGMVGNAALQAEFVGEFGERKYPKLPCGRSAVADA